MTYYRDEPQQSRDDVIAANAVQRAKHEGHMADLLYFTLSNISDADREALFTESTSLFVWWRQHNMLMAAKDRT